MVNARCIALFVLGALVLVGAQGGSAKEQEMEGHQLAVENVIEPIYIYASQPGRVTFDQGDSGGNPFASALVETLGSEALRFKELLHQLIALTATKSEGRQRPDVRDHARLNTWRVLPKSPRERRVALVVVFSDYSASEGAKSLPGAARDLSRVGDAFKKAGFAVQRVLDPDRAELRDILRGFADRSAVSAVAAVYTTGHGVEVDGAVYLLPGDYPVSQGDTALGQRAIRLTKLGAASRAKHANLIFYGGCRNNPFN